MLNYHWVQAVLFLYFFTYIYIKQYTQPSKNSTTLPWGNNCCSLYYSNIKTKYHIYITIILGHPGEIGPMGIKGHEGEKGDKCERGDQGSEGQKGEMVI